MPPAIWIVSVDPTAYSGLQLFCQMEGQIGCFDSYISYNCKMCLLSWLKQSGDMEGYTILLRPRNEDIIIRCHHYRSLEGQTELNLIWHSIYFDTRIDLTVRVNGQQSLRGVQNAIGKQLCSPKNVCDTPAFGKSRFLEPKALLLEQTLR